MGCCWWGLVWGLLVSNFGKISEMSIYEEIFVYCSILRRRELKVLFPV